jgi:hypothetical protein
MGNLVDRTKLECEMRSNATTAVEAYPRGDTLAPNGVRAPLPNNLFWSLRMFIRFRFFVLVLS